MRYAGFAELRTPCDLLKKLQYDLERLSDSPEDQFVALDFFFTAEAIIHWLHPNHERERAALRSSCALLRITSHVANGAKHFAATAKHHQSVTKIEKSRYVEHGYCAGDYVEEPLLVFLAPDEALEIGADSIEVVALARRVVEYWKGKLVPTSSALMR